MLIYVDLNKGDSGQTMLKTIENKWCWCSFITEHGETDTISEVLNASHTGGSINGGTPKLLVYNYCNG